MDRQHCAPRQTIFTPQLQLPIAGTRGTRLPPDARLMGRLEQLAEIWRPPVNMLWGPNRAIQYRDVCIHCDIVELSDGNRDVEVDATSAVAALAETAK